MNNLYAKLKNKTKEIYLFVAVVSLFLLNVQAGLSATITVPGDQPSVSAALAVANAGDVIELTNNINEGIIEIDKAITLDGKGFTINSSSPNFGIFIKTTNVIITNLILDGAGTFGIITAVGANGAQISNTTAQNCGGSGFAITGVTNATLTNITSRDNGGNGLSITASQAIVVNGITTSGNGFANNGIEAGVGIFSAVTGSGGSPTYPVCESTDIEFQGTLNFAETFPIYQEQALLGCNFPSITDIRFTGNADIFNYFIGQCESVNGAYATDLCQAYFCANELRNVVGGIFASGCMYLGGLSTGSLTSEWRFQDYYVAKFTSGGVPLFIQDAIDAIPDGQTGNIFVESEEINPNTCACGTGGATYEEKLSVASKNVVFESGDECPGLIHVDGSDNSSSVSTIDVATDGSVTVNTSMRFSNDGGGAIAIENDGLFNNHDNNTIEVNNPAGLGISNKSNGTYNNGNAGGTTPGKIEVENASDAVVNDGTFNNNPSSNLTIHNGSGTISGKGIDNTANGIFNNKTDALIDISFVGKEGIKTVNEFTNDDGDIMIDNAVNAGISVDGDSKFTNTGNLARIDISNITTDNSTGDGIYLTSAQSEFSNADGATIFIEGTARHGIILNSVCFFDNFGNNATITIDGTNNPIGNSGIFIGTGPGDFSNGAGGIINIIDVNDHGVENEGTYVNVDSSVLNITGASNMDDGIRNSGTFYNTASVININNPGSNGINNTGTFNNKDSETFSMTPDTTVITITGAGTNGLANSGSTSNFVNRTISGNASWVFVINPGNDGVQNSGGSVENRGKDALINISGDGDNAISCSNDASIDNSECAVIEIDDDISVSGTAEFLNEGILIIQKDGPGNDAHVFQNIVNRIQNEGIIIDPQNSLNSDLVNRTEDNSKVKDLGGVIAAPFDDACSTDASLSDVLIGDPGTALFVPAVNWFDTETLDGTDQGDFDDASDEFTYGVTPPAGSTERYFFDIIDPNNGDASCRVVGCIDISFVGASAFQVDPLVDVLCGSSNTTDFLVTSQSAGTYSWTTNDVNGNVNGESNGSGVAFGNSIQQMLSLTNSDAGEVIYSVSASGGGGCSSPAIDATAYVLPAISGGPSGSPRGCDAVLLPFQAANIPNLNGIPAFCEGNPFTLSFWYYPWNFNLNMPLLSVTDPNDALADGNYYLERTGQQRLRFTYISGGNPISFTLNTVSLQQFNFYHIGVIFNGLNRVDFYVNGFFQFSLPVVPPNSCDPDIDLMRLGGYPDENAGSKLFGILDEIAIWDVPLCADYMLVMGFLGNGIYPAVDIVTNSLFDLTPANVGGSTDVYDFEQNCSNNTGTPVPTDPADGTCYAFCPSLVGENPNLGLLDPNDPKAMAEYLSPGKEAKLFQNRPNPFNNNTIIEFNLPYDDEVTFSFFGPSGQQIHAVNGQFNQGLNAIQVSLNDLRNTEGLIYYRMKTSSKSITMKMMVIK